MHACMVHNVDHDCAHQYSVVLCTRRTCTVSRAQAVGQYCGRSLQQAAGLPPGSLLSLPLQLILPVNAGHGKHTELLVVQLLQGVQGHDL